MLYSLFIFTSLSFFHVAQAAPCESAIVEKIASINPASEASVRVVSAKGISSPGQTNENIHLGDLIQTDDHSTVDIRLCEGSAIRLSANTSYKIQSVEKSGDLTAWNNELTQGSVRITVTPATKPGFVKFRLQTPTATMGIRGTEFYVNYLSQTEQTKLYTLSGQVLFGKKTDSSAFSAVQGTAPKGFVLVEKDMLSAIDKKSKTPTPPQRFNAKMFATDPLFRSPLNKTSPKAKVEASSAKHAQKSILESKTQLHSAIPKAVPAAKKGKK